MYPMTLPSREIWTCRSSSFAQPRVLLWCNANLWSLVSLDTKLIGKIPQLSDPPCLQRLNGSSRCSLQGYFPGTLLLTLLNKEWWCEDLLFILEGTGSWFFSNQSKYYVCSELLKRPPLKPGLCAGGGRKKRSQRQALNNQKSTFDTWTDIWPQS